MPLVGHPYTNKHINDTTSKINKILVDNRDNIAFLDMSNVKVGGNMDIDDEKLYNDVRNGKTLFVLAIGGNGTKIDGNLVVFPNSERDKCMKKLHNGETEKQELTEELGNARWKNNAYLLVLCIIILLLLGYIAHNNKKYLMEQISM